MRWASPFGVPIPLPMALVFLFFPGIAGAQEYHVSVGAANRVAFVSDAPLEDFEGVTDRIDGFVFLEGQGLAGSTDLEDSELYFEVDLASLDTGIGLRNRHMRENYLDTERYPYASFQGRVTELRPAGDGAFRVVTRGSLAIHGVEDSRELTCGVEVVEAGASGDQPPRRLRVRCDFQVALSDHQIPIPKVMFMKIDEVMDLSLDVYLTVASLSEEEG